jgi:hypothetical protein
MIARLQELLGKPDPALGFLNGELHFWLGWHRKLQSKMALLRKPGDRRAANWNLFSESSRIFICLAFLR